MFSGETRQSLAVFASGYAKRWLDQQYDKLDNVPQWQQLKSLDPKVKYTLEAGLYTLLAYLDRKCASDTPLQKFFREVIKDAPPELAKRLLSEARQEISADSKSAEVVTKTGLESLLQLDDAQLQQMLSWLGSLKGRERDKRLAEIIKLSETDLARIAKLSTEERDVLFGTRTRPGSGKPALAAVNETLKNARARLQERTAQLRSKGTR